MTGDSAITVVIADDHAVVRQGLRLLLEAGSTSGTLRADVDPKDVMRVINGIWYLPDGPQWREDVGRMLELVIDGLRYGVPDRRPQPATNAGACLGNHERFLARSRGQACDERAHTVESTDASAL